MHSEIKVAFVPFWQPYEDYASSRVRGVFPVEILKSSKKIKPVIGFEENCDIYIVIQFCSDRYLNLLRIEKKRGAKIIYNICDPHFLDDKRSFAGIKPNMRFFEISELADAFLSPTAELSKCIKKVVNNKEIFVISDSVDYRGQLKEMVDFQGKKIVWFGNPGGNNFQSLIEYFECFKNNGWELSVISKIESIPKSALKYIDHIYEWSYSSFGSNLRKSSCVFISYDKEDLFKSENRLLSSYIHGVPAIVTRPSTSANILDAIGESEMAVDNSIQLTNALNRISIAKNRKKYFCEFLNLFNKKYSDENYRLEYLNFFEKVLEL